MTSFTSAATPTQARNIKLTVVGLLALILVIVGGFVFQISKPRVMTKSELKLNGAFMFETPRAIPAFSLTDHRGEAFSISELAGKPFLLKFFRGHW